MIKNFLKFAHSRRALFRREIRFSAYVNGIQGKSESSIALSHFIRCGRNERLNSFCAFTASQRDSRMNHRQIFELNGRILWKAFGEDPCQLQCLRGLASEPECNRSES